jgi:hypothetical protein
VTGWVNFGSEVHQRIQIVINFWHVNSKRKTKTGVTELHHKSESGTFIANSDGDKAEILAKFFSSVFTDEDVNNLPKMEKRNSDIATNEPFSQEEVKKLLLGLNTTKSPGPDKALYELANVIDKPLFIIFKKSFDTGIVPENWNVAIITALFKKRDKKLASNYRPVSLTSILCKLLEKLILTKKEYRTYRQIQPV